MTNRRFEKISDLTCFDDSVEKKTLDMTVWKYTTHSCQLGRE